MKGSSGIGSTFPALSMSQSPNQDDDALEQVLLDIFCANFLNQLSELFDIAAIVCRAINTSLGQLNIRALGLVAIEPHPKAEQLNHVREMSSTLVGLIQIFNPRQEAASTVYDTLPIPPTSGLAARVSENATRPPL